MAILADGRTTAAVTLADRGAGILTSSTLIADSGAEPSALPDHAHAPALANATFGPIVTFQVGGGAVSTIFANGVDLEADVEPHGGGQAQRASGRQRVPIHHLNAGQSPFVQFDGMLGMDLLELFGADPVKDRAATRSYLARRA